jgi:hypothetical protein
MVITLVVSLIEVADGYSCLGAGMYEVVVGQINTYVRNTSPVYLEK